MGPEITLNIEVQIKKNSVIALKRLYESQSAIPALSKYQSQIADIADAMMDDVLVSIRVPIKKTIKQAIISLEDS